MKIGPLTTTSIGSFPRPGWLAHRQDNIMLFNLEGAQLKEALDDATALCLWEQEALGLDILTDGEQRRTNFIRHITSHWDGIDFQRLGNKTLFSTTAAP